MINLKIREKKFSVEEFLNQFSIPNQKRTKIKKLIIELFDELKNHKLIETEFGIGQKNGLSITVKQLTPLLLTQSKNIFFHEILSYESIQAEIEGLIDNVQRMKQPIGRFRF